MTAKDKSFIGILGGVTAVCVGGLFFWASKGSSRYDTAKENYDIVSGEISDMERIPLFPTDSNRAEKQKALDSYKSDATQLAEKLKAFRPKEIKTTDPQTFTDSLVKMAAATKDAYAASGLSVDGENGPIPKSFYLGFESYTNTPAQEGATGVLAYELAAISEMHGILASAKPVKLLNFYRQPLDEETGKAYTAEKGATYRSLPVEIAFSGSEKSLRAFVNGLNSSQKYFYLIRSTRILNEKQSGPKASDVQFEDAKASKTGSGVGGGVFDSGSAFVLPSDEPAAPAADKPAEVKPEEKPKSTEQILKQVLGKENIQAFFRIDILLFEADVVIP